MREKLSPAFVGSEGTREAGPEEGEGVRVHILVDEEEGRDQVARRGLAG